ncbi:MAG: hypothetical protein O7D91_15855 [Planctomycetota bacterium]|nr:hypothetical protein [Planctomycetota bacterium]
MGRSDGMVVHKKMSFLASLVWGTCSVIIVTVVCSSGVVFYGLHIVEKSIDDLPSIVKKVPMLRDALSSERRIDYIDDLDIEIDFTDHPYYEDRMRAVVTITNGGQELVSWLSIRVVVSDDKGNVLDEDVEMIATPLALDDDFPGPLVPGRTRRFTICTFKRSDHPSAQYEVTDLRVWAPDAWGHEDEQSASRAASEGAVLSSTAVD